MYASESIYGTQTKRSCTVRALRRARFEPSDIPPTDFVFLPFSLGGTEIFLRRCRGSRPEIGCRAIHHSGEFSREAHPSRMAACMRFPSTHTRALAIALGVWRRPRGVWGSLFCCLVSPQSARLCMWMRVPSAGDRIHHVRMLSSLAASLSMRALNPRRKLSRKRSCGMKRKWKTRLFL